MQVKLFVGNLPWSVGDAELEEVFSPLGQVASARVITDRDTGRSRGFGFVEMSSKEEGQNAISQLNGKEIDGRELKVNEAKPQERRGGGGGGGGGSLISSMIVAVSGFLMIWIALVPSPDINAQITSTCTRTTNVIPTTCLAGSLCCCA